MAKKKKGGSALKAAVAGVAIGAAAGVAAVALSDKRKREQLKKTLNEIKNKGAKGLTEARKKLEQAKLQSKKRLSEELKKAAVKIK